MKNAPLLAYYQPYSFKSHIDHKPSVTQIIHFSEVVCVCGDFSNITAPVTFSPYPLTLNESKYIGLVPLQW